jgi:hypothetical protein
MSNLKTALSRSSLLLLLRALAACGDDDAGSPAEDTSSDTGGSGDDTSTDTGDDTSVDDTTDADTSSTDGSGDDTETDTDPGTRYDVPAGCNPLAANWDCLLPYPSDFFVEGEGADRRVRVSDEAAPRTQRGVATDFTLLHPANGYSHYPVILTVFPEQVDDTNLVFHPTYPESTTDDSPTLLIDAESGERVIHFAELDPLADEPDRQAFIIHPLTRLRNGARYIVAIRNVQGIDGAALAPAEGFRRLRDGEAEAHPALAPLVEHFEQDIFAPLEAQGVERDELQLAWDFTTRTLDDATADLLAIREQAIEAFENQPPAIEVTSVENDVSDAIARRVSGTLEVPLFIESATDLATALHREDGVVRARGTARVPFRMLIPRSVVNADPSGPPARFLQYGHGLFTSLDEMEGDAVTKFADEFGFVVMGVEFIGMTAADQASIVPALTGNTPDLFKFVDRVYQSMANQIAVTYAARDGILNLREIADLRRDLFDIDHLYYYGISNGHILGATYVALSPHIERAVFNVGGAGYVLMIPRSAAFATLKTIADGSFPDPLDYQKFVALTATTFDRIDSITTAKFLLGLPLLAPAPRSIPGFDEVEGPLTRSAYAEYDFNKDPEPGTYAEMTPANEVHGAVRTLAPAVRQANEFLRVDGQIVNFCDGKCDPE